MLNARTNANVGCSDCNHVKGDKRYATTLTTWPFYLATLNITSLPSSVIHAKRQCEGSTLSSSSPRLTFTFSETKDSSTQSPRTKLSSPFSEIEIEIRINYTRVEVITALLFQLKAITFRGRQHKPLDISS